MDPKCLLTSTDLQTRRARCQHQLSFLFLLHLVLFLHLVTVCIVMLIWFSVFVLFVRMDITIIIIIIMASVAYRLTVQHQDQIWNSTLYIVRDCLLPFSSRSCICCWLNTFYLLTFINGFIDWLTDRPIDGIIDFKAVILMCFNVWQQMANLFLLVYSLLVCLATANGQNPGM